MSPALRWRPLIVLATLASLVTVESIALLDQVLFPNYQFVLGSFFLGLSTGLFWALAPLSVGLLLMLIFISPLRYALDLGSRRSQFIFRFHRWILRPVAPFMQWCNNQITDQNISTTLQVTLLAATVLSGIAIGLTPYRPDLNIQGTLVGVDTQKYSTVVGNMLGKNFIDAVHYSFVDPVFKGSRPLVMLFFYGIAATFGTDADGVLRLAPALLASLLAITTFGFVRYGLGDRRTAILAALLSVFSYQVSVSIWAGYYANWLALAECYLLLTTVLSFSKSRSKLAFTGMFASSISLLFTHPWTWTIMVALMGLLALDSRIRNAGRIPWRPISLLLATNIIVDLGRTLLVGSYGGEQAGYAVATQQASPLFVAQVWQNTLGTFSYYDGYLANALYLGLALLAVIGVYRSKDEFSRVLVLWTALVALPFPFLTSIIESRLVYDVPISILAVMGMLKVEKGLGQFQSRLLIALVLLLGANAAMRAVIHLVAFSG